MCDRENDYRVGENCRLQSFLSPLVSSSLPTRDYTCVTQRRKALLFCCVLTTWLLKVASERFTVGGSELRVTMYAAVIMNDRFCAKKHVCSFIESEAFSDNWEFRWTRWKKEVEVNVNWGNVNGVESILHNIFKVNIGTNNGN